MHRIGKRSFKGYTPLDPFRHQLLVRAVRLKITVTRTLLHRRDRAHTAIGFVGTPLEQLDFARGFLGTGKHTADHDGIGAGDHGLGNITGKTDATVGYQRYTSAFERLRNVTDRGNLGHADTSDNARGTDRPRTDADLDRVGTCFNQVARRRTRGDVTADHLHLGKVLFHPADTIQHAARMTVRGIDHDNVNLCLGQRAHAVVGIRAGANSSANAQAVPFIGAGQRVHARLGNILYRDHALHLALVVDHQHSFDAMTMQQFDNFGFVRTLTHGNEVVERDHDRRNRFIQMGLKTQVALGHQADQALAADHRQARNAPLLGEFDDIAHQRFRGDGNRILDNTAFIFLHRRYFSGLQLY